MQAAQPVQNHKASTFHSTYWFSLDTSMRDSTYQVCRTWTYTATKPGLWPTVWAFTHTPKKISHCKSLSTLKMSAIMMQLISDPSVSPNLLMLNAMVRTIYVSVLVQNHKPLLPLVFCVSKRHASQLISAWIEWCLRRSVQTWMRTLNSKCNCLHVWI